MALQEYIESTTVRWKSKHDKKNVRQLITLGKTKSCKREEI